MVFSIVNNFGPFYFLKIIKKKIIKTLLKIFVSGIKSLFPHHNGCVFCSMDYVKTCLKFKSLIPLILTEAIIQMLYLAQDLVPVVLGNWVENFLIYSTFNV